MSESEDESDNVDAANDIQEVINGPKKRGRKPKPKLESSEPSVQEEGNVTKRRGRKKKFQIESIKKLRNEEEDKFVFTANNDHLEKLENQEQISFGSLNITMHNATPIDKHELRKIFNDKFELNDSEKVSNILLQDKNDKKVEPSVEKVEMITNNLENLQIKNNNNNNNTNNNNTNTNIISSSNTNNSIISSKKVVYKKKVHRILNHFIDELNGSKKWPEKTDIWCWWCCHPFESAPIPCPIKYDQITGRFEIKGIFCSWGCCAAYSVENYKSLTHVYTFKKKLVQEEEGNEESRMRTIGGEKIKTAPNKIALNVFGGPLTIEEFRKYSEDLEEYGDHYKNNHSINLSTDKLSYINQEILETYNDNRIKR